jgi:hypothetical protein
MMKQVVFRKQAYLCPKVEIVDIEMENLMQQASGNHSPIGQGGTYGDAKQGNFMDEDEE